MGNRVRLLLDTNTLFWWFSGSDVLSQNARRAIASARSEVVVSVVSAWEIAIKTKSGKLDAQILVSDFGGFLDRAAFSVLKISLDHVIRAGSLTEHHKDPFDRLLVAQAQTESLTLVSNDKIFDQYGVRRVW